MGNVKALGENRIGFYAVIFDSVDLQGEKFTKETDFGIHTQIPVLYQHAQDEHLKARRLGVAEIVRRDDVGLWMEAQLELRDDYEKAIMQLVRDGKLGVSTGALSHTVQRQGGVIKSWWLGEVSLTPIPAEPKTFVLAMKETVIESQAEDSLQADKATAVSISVIDNNDEDMMTDVEKRVDSLEEQLKNVGSGLDKILTLLANEPKVANSGTLIADGATGTDATIKSLPDFFLAVKNGNTQRLQRVYGATKDMSDTLGSAGGYLIPEEFNASLMGVVAQQSDFLNLCRIQNVGTAYGRFPIPKITVVPTANVGQTAFASGVTTAVKPSGSAYTETTPSIEMIEYTIRTIGGFTDVPKELTADSAVSIQQLFTNLAGQAILAKQEYGVIRGSGVGEYLGFANSACDATIFLDADVAGVFDYQDASELKARHHTMNPATVRWIANPTNFADFAQMQIGANGNSVLGQTTIGGRTYQTLHTIPIIYSQHMAAADSDNDIALVDFSAYIRFVRAGMTVFFSPHQKATDGLDVFVFDIREDGKPMLPNKITLADGSTTISPFVVNTYP